MVARPPVRVWAGKTAQATLAAPVGRPNSFSMR
jgi:hypothetical protein